MGENAKKLKACIMTKDAFAVVAGFDMDPGVKAGLIAAMEDAFTSRSGKPWSYDPDEWTKDWNALGPSKTAKKWGMTRSAAGKRTYHLRSAYDRTDLKLYSRND